jgi:hypothetical protein
MPRTVLALLAVVALSVVIEGAGPPAAMAGERWRRPLPGGAVVGAFTFERAAPYVRGRRRGIDVAGRPGARVLAACGGVVAHAGRVPGFGRGVTLRCGRVVATELGLTGLTVRRGDAVPAGAPIGRLGPRGVLRLGARDAGDRQGYRDPLALTGDAAPVVAPPAAAHRPGRRVPLPAAAPRAPVAAPARAPLQWPVFAGLALLAGGLATGSVTRVRRRRRRRTEMALAQR